MGIYLVINIAIVIFMIWFARRRKRVTANGKAVLISGCDTGFGNLAAKALDKLNFCVLAGCFTEEGMEKLDKETSDNVIVFHLDVTDEKSIEEAKDLVYKYCSSRQLWAVVNNAGVLLGFETEVTSMKTFKRVMDVNFLGMVALTKKVLPLIRKSRGRVINIASILGRYASRGFDAYIASKFAVIGWSDCLRQSLSVWGCKVITIEPGVMNTNLLNNLVYSFDDDFSKSTEEVKADYGRDYVKNATRLLNLIEKKSELIHSTFATK